MNRVSVKLVEVRNFIFVVLSLDVKGSQFIEV